MLKGGATGRIDRRIWVAVVTAMAVVCLVLFVSARQRHNDDVVATESAALVRRLAALSIVEGYPGATAPQSTQSPVTGAPVDAGLGILRLPTGTAIPSASEPSVPGEPGALPGGVDPDPAAPLGPSDVGLDAVAVLSPLLDSADFGSTIGFLLVCQTVAGAGAAGVAEAGLSEALAPIFVQVAPACRSISEQAVAGIAQLRDAIAPLAALNPASEEFFQQAQVIAGILQDLSGELGPLGPTADVVGEMIAFFGPP